MLPRIITADLPPVGPLGFGDISLSTAANRGVDHRDLARAVDEAFELGVTVFDVAPETDSAKLVGDAVRAHRARDRVVVMTRVELRDFDLQIDGTLRALRLDAVPLVQLPIGKLDDKQRWMCDRLVREGKVIAWCATPDASFAEVIEAPEPAPPPIDAGFTTTSSGLFIPSATYEAPKPPTTFAIGEAGLAVPSELVPKARLVGETFAAIAVPLSYCERELLPVVERAEKIPTFARRPLAGGFLCGRTKFSPRDDRFDVELPDLTSLREHLERTDCKSLAELALRWVLERGAIALPRLHRHENVIDAIRILNAFPVSSVG